MLTTLLAVAGATAAAAWAYCKFRSWLRRHRAADAAETENYQSLDEYVARAEHPTAPSRWATPKDNRGP